MATHIKISTITVGSGGAASIDFTSIPATYTDLKLVLSGRTDNTNRTQQLFFNNDTTQSHYFYRVLYGDGSSALSSNSNNAYFIQADASTDTASVFGSTEIYIPNYLSANQKSLSVDSLLENNATGAIASLLAGLWNQTSAITQITLTPYLGNWAQYSSATLYGIKSS